MPQDKILNAAESYDYEELLKSLIEIPSYREEKQIAGYIASRLKRNNIKSKPVRVDDGRYNVYAEFGKGKKSILLNAHLDTVPPNDKWKKKPFSPEVNKDVVYGLGATDDKGTLTAMIACMEILSRRKLNGRIMFLGACAEETTSLGAIDAVKNGINADFSIIGEPTELQPYVGHKGCMRFKITTRGVACHSSNPSKGINAIEKMADIIVRLKELSKKLSGRKFKFYTPPSIAVTTINGGTAQNVIPNQCEIILDRRVLPSENPAAVEKEIYRHIKAIAEKDADLKFTVRKTRFMPPSHNEKNHPMIDMLCSSIRKVMKRDAVISGHTAACDMTYFFNNAKIPSVIFGPGRFSDCHVQDEKIRLREIKQATKILVISILEYLK